MQQQTPLNRSRGWLLVALVAGVSLLGSIYPLVAEPENRPGAVAMIGFAGLALGMSAGPLRQGDPSTWRVMWVFPAALALIAVLMDDGAFTIYSLVLAAVAGLGLVWSRPVASPPSTEPSPRSTETMT